MFLRTCRLVTLVTCVLLVGRPGPVRGQGKAGVQPEVNSKGPTARVVVQRGLTFLEQDVTKWRADHECATCHHGVMTVWAYSEARRQGYAVGLETMKETVAWAKQRWMERVDQPRDTRPGWKMVSTPAIYFALIARCVENQDAFSAAELQRITNHLLRHQESSGAWEWSSAPPGNRPPPFFESDEVATRLACMALGTRLPAEAPEVAAVRDSREKAATWLASTPPADTTQAASVRLLMSVLAQEPAEAIESAVVAVLRRQNKDGGWGQLAELPSDGYATGQALYMLGLAGLKSDRPEIGRGIDFLIRTQLDNGSWPMQSRAHPGAEPYKNPVPITYFGSAWATLGLMRVIPLPMAGDANGPKP